MPPTKTSGAPSPLTSPAPCTTSARPAGRARRRVEDLQVVALAEQALGELDQRALPQVVGARLERQPEDADPAPPDATTVDRAPQVRLVGREHARRATGGPRRAGARCGAAPAGPSGGRSRRRRSPASGRPRKLSLVSARKTSMTACESRPGRADAPISFAKGDLQRVEGVVDVLRHLGHRDRHAEHGAGQPLVERADHVATRRVALADHGLRRREEVADACLRAGTPG